MYFKLNCIPKGFIRKKSHRKGKIILHVRLSQPSSIKFIHNKTKKIIIHIIISTDIKPLAYLKVNLGYFTVHYNFLIVTQHTTYEYRLCLRGA